MMLLGWLSLLGIQQQQPRLNYTVGQQIAYDLAGVVVSSGRNETGGELGQAAGGLSLVNATMLVKAIATPPPAEGAPPGTLRFVTNLFGVVVSNDGGDHWDRVTDPDEALGEDLYFDQTPLGQVLGISYATDDSDLVTNVKVGAVNALHTYLVPAGETKTINETDAVGNHSSRLTGVPAESLLHVHKAFDASDIALFADPNLEPSQVQFNNTAFVGLHPEGYLHSGSCIQDMTLLHAGSDSEGNVRLSASQGADNTDLAGWNSYSLHARGHIVLTFNPDGTGAKTLRVDDRERRDAPETVSTTLFGFSRSRAAAHSPPPPPSAPARSARDVPSGADFPFNKSWSTRASIGPESQEHKWRTLNTNFTADVFAGTNFDCKQPTFNYEAEAHAESWVDIFGYTRQLFFAQVIYGAEGGQQLSNNVVVNAWGKQIYSKALPTIDCSEHTLPLAHSEPGFDKKFSLWTSFIPVTFEVKATLDLDLSWTWQICDTDLSASVSLVPKATLSVLGSAEVNVLVAQTTTELEASFNQYLVPSINLHGSECYVDFKVERKSDPMTAEFHSYYKYKKCKFLVFDCKWSDQFDKVWWNWNAPSVDKVEYEQLFNITKLS